MAVLFMATGLAQQVQITQSQVTARLRELYPETADAKKEIANALQQAAKDHKRVLLVFGADWCFDCFALDYRFHQPDIQPKVDNNYHVVHVDIGQNDRNTDLIKKYNIPVEKGIPAIAVLDSKGNRLNSTAEFESARSIDPQEIVKFLEIWKPTS